MLTRLKSTLAGLTVWGLFVAGALTLGTPVERPTAPAILAPSPTADIVATDDAAAALRSARRTARLQLAVPYFSFGGLLPRQES